MLPLSVQKSMFIIASMNACQKQNTMFWWEIFGKEKAEFHKSSCS
jgi:hypothetical protein